MLCCSAHKFYLLCPILCSHVKDLCERYVLRNKVTFSFAIKLLEYIKLNIKYDFLNT